MRIVQYLTPGQDYDPMFKGNPNFQLAIEQTIRRRLELRELDVVEIHGVMD